ncbi:hypothetical protein [Streptomyces sp. NPDC020141]|uniref:hypothetical protein n=1 Tax=Streptomyces sp. NPDC020141 TaxID=3365065 RepID=UPI0037A1EED5
MTDSTARIRRHYDGLAALHAPSVIAEAATLLDAYVATAVQHGVDPKRADEDGYLTASAAETIARKYGTPRPERSATETHRLQSALRTAFADEGLEVVPTQVRMGIAVEPVPGGPTWGIHGGLAVALYTDSGWQLMVNTARTTVHTIYAPATDAGAAEVAQLVHGILRGDIADPFRRNR